MDFLGYRGGGCADIWVESDVWVVAMFQAWAGVGWVWLAGAIDKQD